MNLTPAGDGNAWPDPEEADEGRLLYEERAALLPGLWMPPAPDWDDLPETDRQRWRQYAHDAENDL